MSKRQLHSYAKAVFFLALLVANRRENCRAQEAVSESEVTVITLATPHKTVAYLNPAPQGATDPFFSHGYLIQFKPHTDIKPIPNIYLYNSEGQIEHKLTI
jgi:hypothetical protein